MSTKVQKKPLGQHKNDLAALDNVKILPEYDHFYKGPALLTFGFRFGDYLRMNNIDVDYDRDKFRVLLNSISSALAGGLVSRYQYSCIRKVSQILYDSKLMNENHLISDKEFIEIVIILYNKLIQKLTAINNSVSKIKLEKAGLNKNSLNKLRAQIATLQNEN